MEHDSWSCYKTTMKLNGFDYRSGTECAQDSREWRGQMAEALANGGFRRVENGETFVHGSDGTIQFEVYGYLPAPKGAA